MSSMAGALPSGTVTFLFTDVESSTRLLQELGTGAYSQALAEHRVVLRDAVTSHGGVEFGTEGDALFAAFDNAANALQAAVDAQEGLRSGPLRVRMGLHTGSVAVVDGDYVGVDVHMAARVAAAGHGGQVLLSWAAAALVPAERLTPLGEHRLKDFPQPVPIFQFGAASFPPLRTASNTNLPRPISPLVGRQREISEVTAHLRNGTRLLTLTGPGGSGKTRLGIEASSELISDFPAGVYWVGLTALRDPKLVVSAIANTLGAKSELADHIGEREMLLVLDNLEHVIAAAPQLVSLLEACQNLRMLVTSRERLRVHGEVEYPVPPLADAEAVELFTARSRIPAEPAVEDLCRALDNLPLAIELAAARTSILSPSQILDRLAQRLDVLKGGRDTESRQQTLRTTIDWSFELLSPTEQTLFARLAVFRGGCTLEAAEQVAEADLDGLQSLVDKSLLRHGDGRYRMLETIREYASERLEASTDAEAVRARHAGWFRELAEAASPHLWGGNPKEWLDRLEVDADNLRAAAIWLQTRGSGHELQRLAGALWRFWIIRGHGTEAVEVLERALVADESPTAARAVVLMGLSAHLVARADFTPARRRAEEALALSQQLGDPWSVAYSTFLLGHVAVEEGDFAAAPPYLEESLRLFDELGDEYAAGIVAFNLGWAYDELGEPERELELAEEHLRRARDRGDQRLVGFFVKAVAYHARLNGRLEEALTMTLEGLRVNVDLGEKFHIADSVERVAGLLSRTGRARDATVLLSRSVATAAELGPIPPYFQRNIDETLALIHQQLDHDAFDLAWEQGRRITMEQAVTLALDSE